MWGEKSLYGRTFQGVTRATFLIDPEGKVARVWPKVKVQGHVQEILQSVKGGTGAEDAATTGSAALATTEAPASEEPAADEPAPRKAPAKKAAAKKGAVKKAASRRR